MSEYTYTQLHLMVDALAPEPDPLVFYRVAGLVESKDDSGWRREMLDQMRDHAGGDVCAFAINTALIAYDYHQRRKEFVQMLQEAENGTKGLLEAEKEIRAVAMSNVPEPE